MNEHAHLVKLAVHYLQSAKQCNPVFAERGSARISEIPDVIGWNRECLIIECKTSLADLKADRKKQCRNNKGTALGDSRLFLLTVELWNKIKYEPEHFVPEGWGILVAYDNYGVRQIRHNGSSKFNSNVIAERDYLRSRILQIQRFGTGEK